MDDGTATVWTARRVRPVLAAYVAAVFLAFMVMAYFVFHSPDAVVSLLAAGAAAIVSLVPGMVTRTEYRLDAGGLSKRPHRPDRPDAFEPMFAWDELARLQPTSSGFRFEKRVPPAGALATFWRRHLAAGYSGEIHVEPGDRAAVAARLAGSSPPGVEASRLEEP